MFYVIEINYIGPRHLEEHLDLDTIEIKTRPALTNMTKEERIQGWCGTSNDWSVEAHGEYATVEDARAAITEKLGEVRESDIYGDIFETNDPDVDDVVFVCKPGRYHPLPRQASADMVAEREIEAEMPDEELYELYLRYEDDANREGYTLSRDAVLAYMKELRQELRDEEEDEV